jgi:EAL domain-containing protein (putative c-di-GMP-specific phosphodiesterase class I)
MNAAEPMPVPAETMAAELGDAIRQKQLQLYYQPIVSLIDRVASEVEALPRWPRGDGEILAPSDFIEVAGEFDLLADLERWAIETAFEQLSRWRRATDLDVSLNVSEDHVYETALADEIRAAAERHGVEPRRLSVEISETSLIESDEGRLQKLRELAELGIGVMIDDYSGALPAERLAEMPASALKISRRVVAGIPDGARQTETAAAAIRVAGEHGIRVIANGVESPGQLAALRDMGCQFGQGFMFSIPMPAEVLAERALPR